MNSQQIDIFDIMYDRFMFEKGKPIRLVELFSGIGFQRMGLELANIPYEVVGTSEIDKFAIQSYEAIHGDNHLLGNIMDIKGDEMPQDIDLMTYSFPCTDLSKAGTQGGMGEDTNSGLVYEVIRILDELKELDNMPQVLVMENVVDLIQAKFVNEFNTDIQRPLEKLGYTNYVITMNGKDYGIAQNRNRVFMISILGEYNYVEPTPFKLERRLKDYLEDEVDENYYLSDRFLAYATDMTDRNGFVRGDRFNPHTEDSEYGFTVTTNAGNRPTDNFVIEKDHIKVKEDTVKGYKEAYDGDGVYIDRPHQKRGVVQSGMIQTLKTTNNDVGVVVKDNSKIYNPLKGKTDNGWHFEQEVHEDIGCVRTIKAGGGSGNIPKVVVNAKKELTNKMLANGHLKPYDVINHSYTTSREDMIERTENTDGLSPTLTTRPDVLGVVTDTTLCLNSKVDGKQPSLQDRIYDSEGVATAITTSFHPSYTEQLRIRKLTPLETGRLMGMNDTQINKQLAVVSNSQAYKQHGNGIVAHVIGYVIGMMYYDTQQELQAVIESNTQ